MGLRINSNTPALAARRNAEEANGILSTALRQLATGRRINRAADDASGLAAAERFNTLARQGQVEVSNLQSGINYAQTADGGLAVQQDATQRIRELAVQASNGTLTDDQRAALNAEAQQLVEQVNDVAEDTEFNGQNILNEDTSVPVGAGGATVEVAASNAETLGLNDIDLSTAEGAAAAVEAADAALTQIAENRSNVGAQTNRFESAINQREIGVENARASEAIIRDIDIARAVMDRTRGQVLQQGGLSALIQSNVGPQSALQLLGG